MNRRKLFCVLSGRREFAGVAMSTILVLGLAGPFSRATAQGASRTSKAPTTTRPAASYDRLAAPTQNAALTVVFSSPTGELRSLADSTELRWLFDRPVVDLTAEARDLDPATLVSLKPAITGSFRWASTRMLIFTPDRTLPRSTKVQATLWGVKALDGTALARPHVLSFTTPTVKCESRGMDKSAFLVFCDQAVDASSLVAATKVVFRRVYVSPKRYVPVGADLALIRAVDAKGVAGFTNYLDSAGKRPEVLASVSPNLASPTSVPCSDSSIDLCYRFAVTSAPRDGVARLEFGAGIRSREGDVASTAHKSGRLPTFRTPLIVTRGCRVRCNPSQSWMLENIGFNPSPGSADAKIRVKDITNGVKRPDQIYAPFEHLDGGVVPSTWTQPLSLRWATLKPMHTYQVEVDPDVTDQISGFALGYKSITTVSFGRADAYAHVRSGERILPVDSAGVRLRTRNVLEIDRVERKLNRKDIVEIVRSYAGFPKAKPLDLNKETVAVATLSGAADAEVNQVLPAGRKGETGVYLVAARPRTYRSMSRFDSQGEPWTKADADEVTRRAAAATKAGEGTGVDGFGWGSALVQRTNLGITLKSSPANVFVAVTALDTGKAVSGASVTLYAGSSDKAFYSGKTSAEGFVTAPGKSLTDCEVCEVVAVVETKGDLAYAQSRWRSWGDDAPYYDDNTSDAPQKTAIDREWPIERGERRNGTLFAERGVYKLGEEAHIKGVMRTETAAGLAFPTTGAELELEMSDPQGLTIVKKKVELSDRGSFDTTVKIPLSGAQGTYFITVGPASTAFLVAAYRKPDFVVDITATTPEVVRGDKLRADADGRYLFGAPMSGADASVTARWTYGSGPRFSNSDLSDFTFDFACIDPELSGCGDGLSGEVFVSTETTLDSVGHLMVSKQVPISKTRSRAYEMEVESIVKDVSRQAFADRTSILIHPGEFYFGVRTKGVTEANKATKVEIVSVKPEGTPIAGKKATVELVHWDWNYANRQNADGSVAEIGGWKISTVETRQILTQAKAVSLNLTPPKSGYYEIRVHGADDRGNWIESGTTMYASGPGYQAWEGSGEEPVVSLVADKASYQPGDRAVILVKSPWEKAEGMLTVERAGVVSSKRITLPSSASTVELAIDKSSAPNIYVTVTLFGALPKDPKQREIANGKPQVLSTTVSLAVPPADRTLQVKASTPQSSFLPGASTKVDVQVTDAKGSGAASEVTLWAVDEGVLRLTGYSEPDLLSTFYAERALLVNTADSRMRLLSITDDDKGDESGSDVADGGGGGSSTIGEGIRQDFRTLAVWAGAVAVSSSGSASVDMRLPESLTSYRIIAVAASDADQFGVGTSKVEVRKPLMLQPALPRFVNIGDTFEAGVVVFNRTGTVGPVTVRAALGDESLALNGPSEITVPAVGDKPIEVRFAFRANKPGRPNLVFSGGVNGASSGESSDKVAGSFPVSVTQRLAVVATSGSVSASTAGSVSPTERVSTPADVLPGVGGLDVSVSTSSLAGLQNSIRDLVDYPYGCLEQRTSRIRVLLKLSQLNEQFSLPGVPKDLKSVVARELRLLRPFQTTGGGLSYWPGVDYADPYLSARTLILLRDAKAAKVTVPTGMIRGLTKSLQASVGMAANPDDEFSSEEGFDLGPVRSLAAYALAREGKPESASVDALYSDRYQFPFEEQVYLLRAMLEAGEVSERTAALFSDLLASVRIENDRAFVQSGLNYNGSPGLSYLLSNTSGRSVRDTSLLAALLTRVDPKHPLIPKMATWLVAARTKGTWGNTLESGEALDALLQVATATEAQAPELATVITLGTKTLIDESFSGRSLDVRSKSTPISEAAAAGKDFAVKAIGTGTVNWSARLRYAVAPQRIVAIDQGFTIERSYALFDPVTARSAEATKKTGTRTAPATTFTAGDLVRVTLRISSPQERSNVAIEDLLPAGFEALNAQLTTTSSEELRGESADGEDTQTTLSAQTPWQAGIDHTEIRDDRVLLFATWLEPGAFTYTYVARATAPGTFVAPPAQVEEMYHSEVMGRTRAATIKISAPKQAA